MPFRALVGHRRVLALLRDLGIMAALERNASPKVVADWLVLNL